MEIEEAFGKVFGYTVAVGVGVFVVGVIIKGVIWAWNWV